MGTVPVESKTEATHADPDGLRAHADQTDERATSSEGRADITQDWVDPLEERVDVRQGLIAELRAEGLRSRQHAENLEQALLSARLIGTAVGIVMADRKVGEDVAFEILARASQNTNVKLRLVAEAVVRTGDVGLLPTVHNVHSHS